MKKITFLLSLSLFILSVSSCGKCKNEDPTARVLNNGTGSANIQIKDSDGSIVSISDLSKGSISSTKEHAPGSTTVTLTIENVEKTESFILKTCTNNDITINSDNELVMFSKDIK